MVVLIFVSPGKKNEAFNEEATNHGFILQFFLNAYTSQGLLNEVMAAHLLHSLRDINSGLGLNICYLAKHMKYHDIKNMKAGGKS